MALFAELQECINRFVLEVLVALRIFSSHSADDLNIQSYGGVLLLARWILAENKAEIHMKEVAVLGNKQVIEMPVSDCKQVGRDSVAGA